TSTVGFTLTVDSLPPPTITTPSRLPDGAQGYPYRVQLAATGGLPPYTWSFPPGSYLPGGLNLASSGLISGTAPGAADYCPCPIQVTDSRGYSSVVGFTITVGPPPPPLTITTTSLPTAVANVPYSYQLTASGGLGSYTWSFSQGATANIHGQTDILGQSIWSNLGMSTGGLISGTTAPGYALGDGSTYPITVYIQVTDAGGVT